MHHHYRARYCACGFAALQIHHVEPVVEIERAQRLIQQQQRRLTDQRLRQSRRLFLAAGQLIRITQRQMGVPSLFRKTITSASLPALLRPPGGARCAR